MNETGYAANIGMCECGCGCEWYACYAYLDCVERAIKPKGLR